MRWRWRGRAVASAASWALASWTLPAWVLLGSRDANALEGPELGGQAVHVEINESTSVAYNADNRNTRRADVASLADDHWGLWSNRLDARARAGNFRLQLRMDSAWFYTSRSPSDIGLDLLELEHDGNLPQDYTTRDADFFVQKYFQAGRELSDRFVSWNYPAKYSLSYSTPAFEATLGDFSAQFGRGLVLSVRRQDELLGDTTVRGARASVKLRQEVLDLRLTGIVGTLNPVRIDESSGRVLATSSSVRSGLGVFTEAGMPTPVQSAFAPEGRPSYAPDAVYGFEIEGKGSWAAASLAVSRLERSCDEGAESCALAFDWVRAASQIDTWGVALDFPKLWSAARWGSQAALHVSYAQQRLQDFAAPANVGGMPDAEAGHAVYADLNVTWRPVAFSFEGKHYRSFYPLRANIDPGRAREFIPVQYSSPPTTMPVWNDTEFEGFNTCVSGGRLKSDVRVSSRHNLYAWLGRYYTWAESVAANTCDTVEDNLNRVWDVAQGASWAAADGDLRADLMWGARFDEAERELVDALNRPTHVYYRELYTRYDVSLELTSDHSLHFQGWHRRRRQTQGGPIEPWLQGVTVTSLQWGARLNTAFGFEYDQNPAFPDVYLNAQVRYELDGPDGVMPWLAGPSHLSVFAGQRQGGLRCVSGVCRVFAPFEGARVDLTLGF